MAPQELQRRYKAVAREIVERVEEMERRDAEVTGEIEKLREARELEIKVWKKMREARD